MSSYSTCSCGMVSFRVRATSCRPSTASRVDRMLSAFSRTLFQCCCTPLCCASSLAGRPVSGLPSVTLVQNCWNSSRERRSWSNASAVPPAASVAFFAISWESTRISAVLAMYCWSFWPSLLMMNSTTTSRTVNAISAAIRLATSLLPPCPVLSLPALFFIFWLPASFFWKWQSWYSRLQMDGVMFLPVPSYLPLRNIKKAFVLHQGAGGEHFPDFIVTFITAADERLNAVGDTGGVGPEFVFGEILHAQYRVNHQAAEYVILFDNQYPSFTGIARRAGDVEKGRQVNQGQQPPPDVGRAHQEGTDTRYVGKTGHVQDFGDFSHRSHVMRSGQNKADAVPQFNGFFLLRQASRKGAAAPGDIRQNSKRGGLGGHGHSKIRDQSIRLLIVLIRSSSLTGLTR